MIAFLTGLLAALQDPGAREPWTVLVDHPAHGWVDHSRWANRETAEHVADALADRHGVRTAVMAW